MTKKEREEFERQRRQLEYWAKTDKEHKAYLKAHPDKPLTVAELEWLRNYQKMTHDPRWW